MEKTENNASSQDAKKALQLRRLGIALTAISMIWYVVARFIPAPDMAAAVLMNWQFVGFPLGLFLLYRSKQFLAKSKPAESLDDPRPPVVLLRPFKVDSTTRSRVILGLFNPVWAATQFSTVEEQLRDVLRPIGPLVAIGDPHEVLPPPGAARFHESEKTWQNRIIDMFNKARLVLLAPGESAGVLWEVRTALQILDPKKLVLFAQLNLQPKAYEATAQIFQEVKGRDLPSFHDFKKQRGCYVTFDENWNPQIVSSRGAPKLRGGFFKGNQTALHYAFKPLFQANGVEWHPYPISAISVLFAGVGLLFLGGAAVGIISVIIDSYQRKDVDYTRHYQSEQSPVQTQIIPEASQQVNEQELIASMTNEATTVNQELPMMVSEDMRMDEVTVGPGARLVLHFSFPKYTSKMIDADKIYTEVKPVIMREACADNEFQKLLQRGVIGVYAYSGNDGIEVGRFEIGRDDCSLP